jgi:hypothetical protein
MPSVALATAIMAGGLLCSPALASPIRAGDPANLGTWSDLYVAARQLNTLPDSANIGVLPDGPGLAIGPGAAVGQSALLNNIGDYYVLSEPGVVWSATKGDASWSDIVYVGDNFHALYAASDNEGVWDQTVLNALTGVLVGHAVETPGIWQDVGVPFSGVDANTLLLVSDGDPGEGSATPLPAALPLFAGGLGVMGLFGWRRERKAAALAAV